MSGGVDSLALMCLAAEIRPGFPPFHVATVDHGLRDRSAAEADTVGALAARLGLPHATLAWTGPKEGGNLQARARNARYRLLARHAGRLGAGAILTAHQADDQIETHRLAMARGAGDRGLAGMRACRELEPGLFLLRPLLGVSRFRLAASVAARGLDAAQDPGNADPRFARARIRRDLADLAEGERQAILAAVAAHAARRDRADAALSRLMRGLAGANRFAVDGRGVVRLDAAGLRAAPPDIRRLLLARVLAAAVGAPYPPAAEAVARLAERFRAPFAATLGGAAIRVDAAGTTAVFREYGRDGIESQPMHRAEATVFDGRLRIEAAIGSDPAARLVAFGALGRGNAVERTLPVYLDGGGRPRAAHPALLRKLNETVVALACGELVSFRLYRDLPPPSAT